MSSYRPKPPLWRAKVRASRWTSALILSLFVVLGVAVPIAFEREFVSVPGGQTEAVVLRVEAERPSAVGPAWFRYVAQLPNGSGAVLASDHLYRPGTRLIVTISRGRITGRTWLSGPYHMLSEGELQGPNAGSGR